MRGKLQTGRIDLGKFSVKGYILDPRPAAIITAWNSAIYCFLISATYTYITVLFGSKSLVF